jgi:hypothetical protein
VIAAIATALLGAWLPRRVGTKPIYLAGLAPRRDRTTGGADAAMRMAAGLGR